MQGEKDKRVDITEQGKRMEQSHKQNDSRDCSQDLKRQIGKMCGLTT